MHVQEEKLYVHHIFLDLDKMGFNILGIMKYLEHTVLVKIKPTSN